MSSCQRRMAPGVTRSRIANQELRRHCPREQRQPRPVRPCQTRVSAGPLALGHSELVAQHEDLGVLPPPLPPRQPQQPHGTDDNQEDQPQPHKPKIIARPGRRRGPEQPAVSAASGQVAQVFGTHKMLERTLATCGTEPECHETIAPSAPTRDASSAVGPSARLPGQSRQPSRGKHSGRPLGAR
jgi:hypothetical protein